MKKLKRVILFFSLLLLGINTAGIAQPQSSPKEDSLSQHQDLFDHFHWVNSHNSVHELHFVGGYSFHSTRGFWGKISGAKLQVWGLRYNRKLFLFNGKHFIEYVGELNFSVDYKLTATQDGITPGNFSGFGITPIGFQFNWNRKNIVQPFFKSSTGFMHLKKRFPNDRGAQFNFTLELGGGIEFVVAENFSLTLGYKYHHMSNGQFGSINPGVDSNIFYSGITIF